MILLKSFLRKKKTKIYIKLFSILFIVLFLLSCFLIYTQKQLNDFKYNHTSLLVFAKKNQETLLKKEKGVTSYRRALTFDIGTDNDIIYNPPIKINGTSIEYVEPLDTTKLIWDRLTYNDKILAFSSSTCEQQLKNNEVILALDKNDYNIDYRENYIDKEINFKYNKAEINLILKNFLESKTFNYICISDELYNNLIVNSDNYIYDIKATNYEELKKMQIKWTELKNEFYNIESIEKYKEAYESNKEINLKSMLSILNVANIIFIIIFIIIITVVIKDIISDENKDILLLKQVGFSKWQNRRNTIKNLLVLNSIALLISFLICFFFSIIITIFLDFDIKFSNIKIFIQLIIFVSIVEILFTILNIKK